MADLDNLVVTVGGDISDLQTAFDQIPAAAQAAASAVQDAFAGQTDLFSDVGAQAQQAFAAVPEAAATAADGGFSARVAALDISGRCKPGDRPPSLQWPTGDAPDP